MKGSVALVRWRKRSRRRKKNSRSDPARSGARDSIPAEGDLHRTAEERWFGFGGGRDGHAHRGASSRRDGSTAVVERARPVRAGDAVPLRPAGPVPRDPTQTTDHGGGTTHHPASLLSVLTLPSGTESARSRTGCARDGMLTRNPQ